ncbi:MAG: FHA domain-containing protein [Planctomycetota bacterium]
MARLIVHRDEGTSVFVIDGDRMTIGRDHACDVRLPHKQVAPVQCEIRRSGGDYVIEQIDPDLFTLLNGSLVTQGVLSDGDRLEVAKFLIEFQGDRDFAREPSLFEMDETAGTVASKKEKTPAESADAKDKAQPAERRAPVDGAKGKAPIRENPDAQGAVADVPKVSDSQKERKPVEVVSDWQSIRQDEGAAKTLQGAVWYYTIGDEEKGPLTLPVLVRKIDEGEITAQTLLRGPTNPIRAQKASMVRGVARFFRVCQGCGARVEEDQVFCHQCGENLTHKLVERGNAANSGLAREVRRRSWKGGLVLLAVLGVVGALVPGGLWRAVVGAETAEKIGAKVEGLANVIARVAGPEHFERWRATLEQARMCAIALHVGEAAELYTRIEEALRGTSFAESARREREEVLSQLYSRASEAASKGRFADARRKLEIASEDPLFFALYPAAKDKMARWDGAAGSEEGDP